jgi:NADH:ubiquinone oxidoreductase subunit H
MEILYIIYIFRKLIGSVVLRLGPLNVDGGGAVVLCETGIRLKQPWALSACRAAWA